MKGAWKWRVHAGRGGQRMRQHWCSIRVCEICDWCINTLTRLDVRCWMLSNLLHYDANCIFSCLFSVKHLFNQPTGLHQASRLTAESEKILKELQTQKYWPRKVRMIFPRNQSADYRLKWFIFNKIAMTFLNKTLQNIIFGFYIRFWCIFLGWVGMSTFWETLDFEYWCANPTCQDPKLDRFLAEINNFIGILGIYFKKQNYRPSPFPSCRSALGIHPHLKARAVQGKWEVGWRDRWSLCLDMCILWILQKKRNI